eukprot:1183679-Prorocentrum_minimum.AAC.2
MVPGYPGLTVPGGVTLTTPTRFATPPPAAVVVSPAERFLHLAERGDEEVAHQAPPVLLLLDDYSAQPAVPGGSPPLPPPVSPLPEAQHALASEWRTRASRRRVGRSRTACFRGTSPSALGPWGWRRPAGQPRSSFPSGCRPSPCEKRASQVRAQVRARVRSHGQGVEPRCGARGYTWSHGQG